MKKGDEVFLTEPIGGVGKGPFTVLGVDEVSGSVKLTRVGGVHISQIANQREEFDKVFKGSLPIVSAENPLEDMKRHNNGENINQVSSIKHDMLKQTQLLAQESKRPAEKPKPAPYPTDKELIDKILISMESLTGKILTSQDPMVKEYARKLMEAIWILKDEQKNAPKSEGSKEDSDRD